MATASTSSARPVSNSSSSGHGQDVYKIEQLNVNDIAFSTPKPNKNSPGKTVYLTIHGKPLRIQTPKMKCPFGISGFREPRTGQILKYTLEPSFENLDENIYYQFSAIEERLVAFGCANSIEFMGGKKPQNPDVVRAFFQTCLRSDPKAVYADRLRCKVNINTETQKFTCSAFTGTKPYKELDLNAANHEVVVPKGCEIRAILSCSGWVVDKKFGLTWRVEQIQIFPNVGRLTGFAFVDDHSGGEDEEEDQGESPEDEEEWGGGAQQEQNEEEDEDE